MFCISLPGVEKFSKKYKNEQFGSFLEIFQLFLKESKITTSPHSACFAVAGPVKNNRVVFTNLNNWVIDGAEVSYFLNIKTVRLINDFVAVGYGILTLNEATECIQLQGGPKDPSAPIAAIGAGTGLGECFLAPDNSGVYNCFASEGGHAEFAPRNDLEVSLLLFLKTKFNQRHRVSVERVVSGTGIGNVYEFLCTVFPEKIDPILHAKIETAGAEKGGIIAGNQKESEICKKAMEIFATAYGSEAGVAGLKFLPYGGLYLCGGLTPKNIDLLKGPNSLFLDAFNDKGRVSHMLSTIPLFAVMTEDVGGRGALLVAFHDLYLEQGFDTTGILCSTPAVKNNSKKYYQTLYILSLTTALFCASVAAIQLIKKL